MTASQKCVVCVSVSFVLSPYIKLEPLESLLFRDVCNVLPAVTVVAFRYGHPDRATMKHMKKALSDNGINFRQLKDWNADRCLDGSKKC